MYITLKSNHILEILPTMYVDEMLYLMVKYYHIVFFSPLLTV